MLGVRGARLLGVLQLVIIHMGAASGHPNSIARDTYLYATVDFADPHSHSIGCQKGLLPLPSGWSLVPSADFVVRSVIRQYGWATYCLVLGDGTSWPTANYYTADSWDALA